MSFARLPNTTVIAFGHRARHGKDSAAQLIAESHPSARRYGFADALKAVSRVQWGMRQKDAPLLQRVGVAYRSIDPEIWLRALYWTIAEQQPPVALITDLRFPNEFDLVREMGGFTVKVERRGADGALFVPADRDPNHESEIALAHETRWDAVITNPEGEMETFRREVLRTFTALMSRGRSPASGGPYGQAQKAA